MKQKFLYNQMVRLYNRSRKKLQSLTAAGKNLRKQDILKRRIARLFNLLTGMQYALKTGATAMVLSAGMVLFQPNAAQAQITFGPMQTSPFGLTSIPGYSGADRSAFADLNGDGRLDIIAMGVNSPTFYYFQNTGTNTAPAFAPYVGNPFGLPGNIFNASPTFADLDNDGDLDLLVANAGSGNFYYLQNTGTPASPAFAAAVTNPFGLTNVGQGNDPTFVDLDNDGDLDLMVGTDIFNGLKYFQNTGTTVAPAFAPVVTNPFGLIPADWKQTPTFADLDSDGDWDMLSGKYSGEFSYYQNTGTNAAPAFAPAVTNPFGLTYPGLVNAPEFGDLDNDGDMDLMVMDFYGGNLIYYFENTTSTCIPPTTPTFNPDIINNCGTQSTTLTIATGQLNSAFQWHWYKDSCGGTSLGIGTSMTVSPTVTTTYYVRGTASVGPCIVQGNCGSITVVVNTPPIWYLDFDADGFGNNAVTLSACTQPAGYVSNNTDCNDTNASVNTPQPYYVDADLDGYGSAATALFCSLVVEEGYSINTGDCNDGNASVYPDANEVCGNGIDDNCNTLADEECCAIPTGLTTTNITATGATFNWNQVPGAVKYKFQYKVANESVWHTFSVSAPATSHQLTGINPATTYKWKIKSICNGTKSIFSPLVKFTTLALKSDDVLNENETADLQLNIYPNPSQGNFTVAFDLGNGENGNAALQIFNGMGQLVYESTADVSNGMVDQKINATANLASGNYFVRMIFNQKLYMGKVEVLK